MSKQSQRWIRVWRIAARRGLLVVAGAGMVLAVVVVAGAGAAGANPAEEPEVTEDVRCLKAPDQMAPGSIGTAVTEAITPVVGQAQGARRAMWALNWLGVPVPGALNDMAGLTTTVSATGPQWYVDEARTEAEDHDNCALARWHPIGGCENYQVVEPDRYGSSSSADPDAAPVEPDIGNRNGITGFLPDKCWGAYPADSYDLHYEGGGAFDWNRKIWGGMTGFFHHVGKGAMQISLGLLGFAFSTFRVLDYRDVALTASTRYQDNLIGPFGLADIAWFVLFAYTAVKALRGKLAVAGGEIVMSMVLITLAGVLMANRDGYLEGASTTMDELTTSILAAGSGEQPATTGGSDTVWYVRPVQKTLFEEFIDRPFDYINFGGQITEQTCIDRRNNILWAGVPNDGGWGIRYMDGRDENDTTCDAHAIAMGVPSGDRMLIALITMAVCLGVALIVAGAALTMLVAKVLLLVLFAMAPFAAVAAILPGLGRRLAWGWVGILVQAIVAGSGMAFVLSLFLLSVQAVVEQTAALGPFERWVVMLVIVGVIYLMRQRILGSSKSLANSLADNLTRLSPAAAHWQGGSNMGLDLRSADRGIARMSKSTVGYGLQQAPLMGLAVAGGVFGLGAAGYGRWKSGRIALNNLRKMERYREDAGHATGRRLPFGVRSRRAAMRRAARRGDGGYGGGTGGRPPGGGPPPRPPGGGPRPRPQPPSGPRPQGGGRDGRRQRGGQGAGGQQRASGNWIAARWDLARDVMRFDRGAEVASSAWRGTAQGAQRAWRGTAAATNRTWDRSTVAMGRGARKVTRSSGHPGPGGRPLRMATVQARWAERQAAQPANRQPGWAAKRSEHRRGIDRRYQARRVWERQAAASFGPGRYRLRPDERKELGFPTAPREARRREMEVFRRAWRTPDSVRVRDVPRSVASNTAREVRAAVRAGQRLINRGRGGRGGGQPGQ